MEWRCSRRIQDSRRTVPREQSRCLPDRVTYVAYIVTGDSYGEASKLLLEILQDPRVRYHYLLKHLNPRHGEQP